MVVHWTFEAEARWASLEGKLITKRARRMGPAQIPTWSASRSLLIIECGSFSSAGALQHIVIDPEFPMLLQQNSRDLFMGSACDVHTKISGCDPMFDPSLLGMDGVATEDDGARFLTVNRRG